MVMMEGNPPNDHDLLNLNFRLGVKQGVKRRPLVLITFEYSNFPLTGVHC